MCDQLRVLRFEVGVLQLPSVSYVACHPVPLTNGQHLVKRLRSPHPMCVLFELGVVSCMWVGKRVMWEHRKTMEWLPLYLGTLGRIILT